MAGLGLSRDEVGGTENNSTAAKEMLAARLEYHYRPKKELRKLRSGDLHEL